MILEMPQIEKKHLKKLCCPKCERPKLRFEHGPEKVMSGTESRTLRCDVCKIDFREADAAIQAAFAELLAHSTPAPVSVHR